MLLPLSDELDAKRVTAVETARLVDGFEMLRRDPRVRPDRIGFVGVSVGGALALVAAADERIAERVWLVVAVGPYYDAASLVASTIGRAYRVSGEIVGWAPSETTREVVRETLLAALPAEERAAVEGGRSPATEAGRQVAGLLASEDLAGAERLLAAGAPELERALRAVSPRYFVDRLRAPLYLMHDRNDEFIPWVESEALAAAHEPEIYHRLEIFEHVEPRAGNLRILARDGWRLLRLIARIFRDAR